MEEDLIRQFSSMETADSQGLRLVFELRAMVGADSLGERSAMLLLGRNNWDVQAAAKAYYEQLSQSQKEKTKMSFSGDVMTIHVLPGQNFVKTWLVRNTGKDKWPEGCKLVFNGRGYNFQTHYSERAKALCPGEEQQISVEMRSLDQRGVFESEWRMVTPLGIRMGEPILMKIIVGDDGTGDLMELFGRLDVSRSSHEDSEMGP